MKTSTNHLATRSPEPTSPSPAGPASSPTSAVEITASSRRRPTNSLPLPARPLRLVVDHEGVTAPDPSARPARSAAKPAIAVVAPVVTPAANAPMTKLANRVGAVLEGAIASVVSKARKPKVPANPLVCLGPGGEFATAYVGERDGSLTATNPEEFVGLAGTDRGSLRPANGSAPMCDTDMCDTESQRALLALAAIGAATAARLKAQMATVYRLASLCRAAMSSVSALSPLHRGAAAVPKRRKSSRKAVVSAAGLFGPATPAGPSAPAVPVPLAAPLAVPLAATATGSARLPACLTAHKSVARSASMNGPARSNPRSKSRKTGSARSKGVPQSSFSTAATQPLLPLAQEVAA